MRVLFTIAIFLTAIRGVLADPVDSKGRLESISKPDPNKSFNLMQGGVSANRTFQTDSFKGKQFYLKEAAAPKTFQARDFSGSRSARVSAYNLPQTDPNLEAKSQIPNANKAAETKTAETKAARDSGKTAPTRELTDANRPYLGPEKKKFDRSIDPEKSLPPSMQAGHVMTLEEIRELLNKNK